MRALTNEERIMLQRTVVGESWNATPEEMLLAANLHRQGLLGFVKVSESLVGYPAIPASSRALRVDAAFQQFCETISK